ncbi:MAG: bifunctional hydroxymethylpyrimidine kinase/phosphomethylpyrimidine kinase, partial [Pseudomonadota bacterium]
MALTIAGSDSSGGAGIQADLKTFTALGVYGATVITALTAQNTRGVSGVHAVPPEFVRDQYDKVVQDLDVRAIKTGMLATREIIEVVADAIRRNPPPFLCVDPVMIATSGDPLITPDAIAAMRSALIPLADVITPNLNEAGALLNTDAARDLSEMEQQGAALLELGCGAVLMKGGHLQGQVVGDSGDTHDAAHAEALDVLVTRDGAVWLRAPRVETPNTHGTGCTLSAGIAAHSVLGHELFDAVTGAKWYLTASLKTAADITYGAGHG